MSTYTCAECGAEVIVSQDGEITRTCEHTEAKIILNLEAVCVGDGSM